MTITLGVDPHGARVTLSDDAAVQTFAFLGRRGSGKSYGAGVLVEALLRAGSQVVILDPVGIWWGLRLAALRLRALRGDEEPC